MANTDNAIGFVPTLKSQAGGEVRLTTCALASSYGTALGRGDPVEYTGASGTEHAYIQKAAAENVDNCGIFMGVHYVDVNGNPVYSDYWPASTVTEGTKDAVAMVCTDPNVTMVIQCDTLAAGDIGALADWDAGTPSATTRKSGVELVASSTGTTGKSIRIKRLAATKNADGSDNAFGAYAKAEVTWAEHIEKTGAAGAGGV